MGKINLKKQTVSWQKVLRYSVGMCFCGIWLAYGMQVGDREVELHQSSADSLAAPHFLVILPSETTHKVLSQLSPLDLVRLGQTSKAICRISEAESLWQPLYQSEIRRLLPFLRVQEAFPVSFCPHKFALRALTLQQRLFATPNLLDGSILESMICKAVPKGGYQDLLLARLYTFLGNEERYEHQAYKLLNYCPERLVQAIYWGKGIFAKKPKQERFQLLEWACENNLSNALMYKISAIVSGELDERPPLERFKTLYQWVLSGDKEGVAHTVCQALSDGKGFGQENRSLEDRFRDLETLALEGKSPQAENIIVDALYQGTFYHDRLSEEERFLRLKAYAEADKDSFAVHHIVSCLVEGQLGQGKRSEVERFDDLLALIPQGSSMLDFASSAAVNALIQGTLGQQERPLTERLKILETLAFEEQERGDRDKQLGRKLIDVIIKGQELGQQEKTSFECFQYLEALSARGLLAAQEAVVEILFQQQEAISQFHLPLDLSEQELFALLETYIQSGYAGSQSAMIKAIHNGNLGQDQKSADERCQHLKIYADLEISLAQEYVNEVIDLGGFKSGSCGFSSWHKSLRRYSEEPPSFPLSPKLLMSLKSEKASQGDRKAQTWIYKALYEGTYGQDQQDPALRFNILQEKALAGDGDAMQWVVKALVSRNLDQESLSDAKTFEALNFWATKGSEEAQKQIADALHQGLLGQSSRSASDRFHHLQELIQQGNIYALETICHFLEVGMPEEVEKWSKPTRIQELERLSTQGYEKAQSVLASSLLGKSHNAGYYPEALKPEDFGATPQERFDALIAYGDSGNLLARLSVMEFLSGGIPQEMRVIENIEQQSYVYLLRWVSQGDFSLMQGIFDFLQRQAAPQKEEDTILMPFKINYLHNLFLLYKIFVNPSLTDFNNMVEAVLRDAGV